VNGLIGTLAGWNVSAQMLWFDSLYNMTIGGGLLIMFAGGLLGTLVVGNFIMLFSIKLKNVKLVATLSAIAVFIIMWTKNMYGTIELISPMNFENDNLIERYVFIGNAAVPYFVVVFLITVLYAVIFYIGTKLSYKKYHIN
jgi:hypothetical protein